ncbi:MAG: hypothetical protein K6D02_10095 [Lachnospiraceae bacterium]|nr:hypothetical protein [Lachnospiraceae bacterium]
MKRLELNGKILNKRIIKRAFALFMAGAVIVSSPLGEKSKEAVKAATTEYVKDVVLSYGKTEEDAKKWLKDNGYKVVEGDLHKGTDVSGKTVNAVLMGYKTTTNPNDAITDISAMPMDGGFKLTDMETILKDQKKAIEDSVDDLIELSGEFKANYKKAVKAKARGKVDCIEAIKVRDTLNKLVDDDSKKGMGDFFLSDFSKEANRDKLVNILIQANPRYVAAMQNVLAMAAGNMNNTWIERMVKLNSNKSYFDRMVLRNKTKVRAKNAIDAAYGEKLDFIVSDWSNLQSKLEEVGNVIEEIADKYGDKKISEEEFNDFFGIKGKIKDIDDDMSDEEKNKVIDNNLKLQENTIDYNNYVEGLSVVSALANEKMNGESLYDFIMKERDFTKGNDRYEICALLEFLSDAQLEAVGKSVDTFTLIKYAFAGDNDTWKTVKKSSIKSMDKEIKTVAKESIYTGVNREVFKGEVAVTSLADTRDINCTYGTSALTVSLAGLSILFSVCGLVFSTGIIYYAVRNLADNLLTFYSNRLYFNVVDSLGNFISKSIYGMPTEYLLNSGKPMDLATKLSQTTANNTTHSQFVNVARISNSIMLAIGIVVAVAAIVISYFSIKKIIEEYSDNHKGDYSVDIPQFMVDIYADEEGNEDLVYYEAVRCNRNDPNMTGVKESNEGLGDYGDLNGDSGKCWVVPYTTKDSLAGDPILADSLTVKHGEVSFKNDVKTLHSFEYKNTGFNITSSVYNYNDKEDGTYLSYKTDSKAFDNYNDISKDVSSAIATDNKAFNAVIFIGIVIGVIVGAMAVAIPEDGKKRRRRKKGTN